MLRNTSGETSRFLITHAPSDNAKFSLEFQMKL